MPSKPWERQEKRLAKIVGGKRNAGSGNGWVRKADVRDGEDRYLYEAKNTAAKSFILKLSDLKAVGHHADREGRIPVMHLEIAGNNYVVLREHDFFNE